MEAILADPANDELRREFADTIRSDDRAWAGYINRSLAIIERRDAPGCIYYDASSGFEGASGMPSELFQRIARGYGAFAGVTVYLERGFAETLNCSVQTFLEHGEELLSLAPILRVKLRSSNAAAISELARCPALGRVYDLELVERVEAITFAEIAASLNLKNLLRLKAPVEGALTDDAWTVMLESPSFRKLLSWGFSETVLHQVGVTTRMVLAPHPYGDEEVEEPHGNYRTAVSCRPMNGESRALEANYGYLPALHAANWKASVLDVLQGRKPDYRAGSSPIETMYEVPPRRIRGVDPGY